MSGPKPTNSTASAIKAPTSKNAAAKKTAARKAAPAKTATTKNAAAKKTAARKAAPAKTATSKNAAAKKAAASKKAVEPRVGRKSKARVKTATAPASKYFKRAQQKARHALDDPDQIRKIAEEAAKSSAHRSGPFAVVLEDFKALIRLVVAYGRGHYRDIPADQMTVIIAGLIYAVSPIDLIPDFLPGGFADDAVVIGWVLKSVHVELDAFRDWELGRETTT